MLRRLRQMEISLATKCQLLFGAAVISVLAAGLFVPWQRIEQLTDQLDEKSAGAVAAAALEHHQRDPVHAMTAATTQPTTAPAFDSLSGREPKLIGTERASSPNQLSRFETAAFARFLNDHKLPFYARTYESSDGTKRAYRYAEPLWQRPSCAACHTDQTAATSPSNPQLLGIISVDIPSQISTRQLLLNRVFILTAGMIAGLLAIIIFYLVITRLILQPVRVLQETAERVRDGDLNIRSDISTGDEFQVLSETFNTMLGNLKTSADQLRAVNKSLDVKLGQLSESNTTLYESNRLKSQFLANVSHELRTPLNSILGFAELLKELTKQSTEPRITRYVQNINSAGHNLLDLINDLLDLAKIEAGRMDVRSEPLSLPDLFEALINLLRPLLEPKLLSILPSVASDVPIIETDPVKLQQVLYNFLSNAIKFSPSNSQVGLGAVRKGEFVVISVSDQGPGIAPEQQAIVFEKFRQLDQSVTREHGGTGLGLAISKELASLLGGTIGITSAPGEGATFHLTIPIKIVGGTKDVRERGGLV